VSGPNGIAGEWGHTPLPYWGRDARLPAAFSGWARALRPRACYCGRENCVETFLSGPGLGRLHTELWAEARDAAQIASADTANARRSLDLYALLLARSLAQIINVLDPHVIVLGGGLSNIQSLYDRVPVLWTGYVFSEEVRTTLRRASLGDSSGVFGAARLWPADTDRGRRRDPVE